MATTTTAVSKTEKVRKKPVTQSYWSLVWWKFKKNRAAVVGGILLLTIYFSFVVIPEFIAPYDKQTVSRFLEARPQTIRFVDSNGTFHLQPFVYGLKQEIDQKLRIRRFVKNPERMYPISLFVQGESYSLFGLNPHNLHSFGLAEKAPRNQSLFMGPTRSATNYLTGVF